MLKKVGLKKALEVFGATDIKIFKDYRSRYGFYRKESQLYYFNVKDVGGECKIMHREAKSKKDYKGGQNMWTINQWLEDHKYKLFIPLVGCDFNKEKHDQS